MGTSGWSAAVGGIVTPAGPETPTASCAAPGPSKTKGLTTRCGAEAGQARPPLSLCRGACGRQARGRENGGRGPTTPATHQTRRLPSWKAEGGGGGERRKGGERWRRGGRQGGREGGVRGRGGFPSPAAGMGWGRGLGANAMDWAAERGLQWRHGRATLPARLPVMHARTSGQPEQARPASASLSRTFMLNTTVSHVASPDAQAAGTTGAGRPKQRLLVCRASFLSLSAKPSRA